MTGETLHQVDSVGVDARTGAWASSLGIIAVVLGLLLAATHANEWMVQSVIQNSTPADQQLPPADCPEDELEEEGITVAECEYMVARVQAYVLTAPSWFPVTQSIISAIGTFAALLSVFVGIALVNFRDWAPRLALAVFAALVLIDAGGFLSALNAGPVIRSEYLWPTLLWFVLHVMMLMACFAAFRTHRSAPTGNSQ